MPDFLRARRNRRHPLRDLAFHLLDLASYEAAYLAGPARRDLFFNSGFLPLAEDFRPLPGHEAEDHAAMMYHFVGLTHPAEAGVSMAPRRILDIGCGPGGGLLYLSSRHPRAALCGTERAAAARRLARRLLPQARILPAGAPLDGRFDLVTGVGTPTYIGLAAFLAQVAPLLAPGGVISISGGYRQGRHDAIRQELTSAADVQGLVLASYRDIAAHTLAALQADLPRREASVARLPRPLRRYARRWADLPGTPEHDDYLRGQRADFAAVFTHAAASDHPRNLSSQASAERSAPAPSRQARAEAR